MCRRSESDSVHSQRRSPAAGREFSLAMFPTLAELLGSGMSALESDAPATLAPTRRRAVRAGAPAMSEKFVIEGGVPLSGTIVPAGNKNGALPILAACLLTEDEVVLRNVPRIRDVEAMLMLLEGLGARVEWRGPSEVSVDACGVSDGCSVDSELAERIRAS